jgi:hypothetical protein
MRRAKRQTLGPPELAATTATPGVDRESLHVAYSALNALRLDFATRKWDTIRTGALIALGVLTAAAGLLSRSGAPSSAYLAAGITLPVSALFLWAWTRANLKRESRLLFHAEFSMSQIERLLGLHVILPEGDRWLPGQDTIFGPKFTDFTYRTALTAEERPDLDLWLTRKLKTHKFIGTIDALFGVFFLASLGFSVALISLAYPRFL